MSRRMSCSMTVDAVRDRSKTVTRRHVDTWQSLKAGDRLTLIEKGMGLPKGAKQVILAEVEILSNQIETLGDITLAEVAAEGFGPNAHLTGRHGWTERDFASFWAGNHGYGTWPNWPEVPCRRISWRYVEVSA
jgi:hypothetical protein